MGSTGPLVMTRIYGSLSSLSDSHLSAAYAMVSDSIQTMVQSALDIDPRAFAFSVYSGPRLDMSTFKRLVKDSDQLFSQIQPHLKYPEYDHFMQTLPSVYVKPTSIETVDAILRESSHNFFPDSKALTESSLRSLNVNGTVLYSFVEVETYQYYLWSGVVLIILAIFVFGCFLYMDYQQVDKFLFRPTIPNINLEKMQ